MHQRNHTQTTLTQENNANEQKQVANTTTDLSQQAKPYHVQALESLIADVTTCLERAAITDTFFLRPEVKLLMSGLALAKSPTLEKFHTRCENLLDAAKPHYKSFFDQSKFLDVLWVKELNVILKKMDTQLREHVTLEKASDKDKYVELLLNGYKDREATLMKKLADAEQQIVTLKEDLARTKALDAVIQSRATAEPISQSSSTASQNNMFRPPIAPRRTSYIPSSAIDSSQKKAEGEATIAKAVSPQSASLIQYMNNFIQEQKASASAANDIKIANSLITQLVYDVATRRQGVGMTQQILTDAQKDKPFTDTTLCEKLVEISKLSDVFPSIRATQKCASFLQISRDGLALPILPDLIRKLEDELNQRNGHAPQTPSAIHDRSQSMTAR